jgi:Rrf2 family iron-sulfur cluster assembly transcriptional regulator
MAMVDLAARDASGCACGPVCLAEIAERQNLSQAYLEQLFGKLRRAGLVGSARGPGGGYRLARSSDSITVADIVAAVDEAGRHESIDEADCPMHGLWHELDRQIRAFLASVTLADVVAGRVRQVAAAPWVEPRLAAD